MKMHELVSWFQLEYPTLVQQMKDADHHLSNRDDYYSYINNVKNGDPVLFFDEDKFDIIKSLNPYHLESDVFTHTMMVCKQAENAPYEVQIAALLHDIGKPSTRAVNPKNGRVSFYNHDAVSAFMSLEILKREELGLSKDQQVHIFNLIALHTQIYKLSHIQLKDIGNISLVTDLIELGKADHAGRFHTAGDAVIPEIDDIFGEVLSGVSSLKRGGHYSTKEKEVIILVGLPAAGKSTWMLNKEYDYPISRDWCINHLAYDALGHEKAWDATYNEKWKAVDQKKVDQLLQSLYKEANKYDNVVVDMTHMSKKSRRKSLSHFGSEYKKKCVVFLPDMPTLFLQNGNRSGKVIDEAVINKMMRSFYPPTMEEFDEIEYVI